MTYSFAAFFSELKNCHNVLLEENDLQLNLSRLISYVQVDDKRPSLKLRKTIGWMTHLVVSISW